ncbi:hypothetical protein ACQ3VF_26055 [Bacillus toyonensis]|uniref:hypothetical protein n=1 Tax=Bacillus toyonensis TaxID=155322 RepID=UPI003D301FE9
MIPLNQKVKVIFADSLNDEWGIPVKTPNTVTYRVRLDFNADARIIEGADGKNIIYSATLYFKGAVPLSYKDFIEYNSGINGMVTENPRVIFPIVDLAGKVIFTKVIV